LHLQVRRTVDASLDARFMAASADLGAEKLHSLPKASSPFTVNDLAALVGRIVKSVAPDPFLAIGKAASRHWRGVFGMETSVGLLDQETMKKARTVTRREDRREIGPATRPTVLSTGTLLRQSLHRETTDLVIEVYEQLTRLFESTQKIPLFRLICDPNSYARSVELLFYISFLVADNRLFVDESSDDVLISLNQSLGEITDVTKKRHRVVCMSMKEWRNAIQKLSIREPMIKLS
jgi:non-structural maintenance of chromosomes element 4